MSCYHPFFAGGPYFSVLSRCGFDEHGGTVDCIKTINSISGINELLVPQGDGSAMTRPESFHKLEELLECPPYASTSDLDNRFRDLCAVLRKAQDNFSCRVEEDQENPFKELRLRLQKAKDRFHARMATGERNFSRSTSQKNPVTNPLQELRDAFRTLRKHFIPLMDQYINRSDCSAALENPLDHDDSTLFRPVSIEISSAKALDSFKILSATESNNDCRTRPPEIPERVSKHTFHTSIESTGQEKLVNCPIRDIGPTPDNPPKGSRLEALITKELQRRHKGDVIHRLETTAMSQSTGFQSAGESNADCYLSTNHEPR